MSASLSQSWVKTTAAAAGPGARCQAGAGGGGGVGGVGGGCQAATFCQQLG